MVKYVPIPTPNELTRADGKVYAEDRVKRRESVETVAARIGVTPAELLKFEAGEGLLLDDDEELRQLPNGRVIFEQAGTWKKPS